MWFLFFVPIITLSGILAVVVVIGKREEKKLKAVQTAVAEKTASEKARSLAERELRIVIASAALESKARQIDEELIVFRTHCLMHSLAMPKCWRCQGVGFKPWKRNEIEDDESGADPSDVVPCACVVEEIVAWDEPEEEPVL